MRAVAAFNAPEGLESPRMPQGETRGDRPIEKPTRRRKSKATGQTET
jgi:hypothetical protein